jgi:hypothetical protein
LIDVSAPFRVEIEFWNLAPQNPLIINLYFHTAQGVCMFETISNTDPNWHNRLVPPGIYRSVCRIPTGQFNDGSYIMGIHFWGASESLYDMPKASSFTVHDLERRVLKHYGKIGGVNRPTLEWDTTLLNR